MDLTFQLVGNIAVWMFVADLILLLLFKSSGKQFKWRMGELGNGLNPYIKKSTVIISALVIFFAVALTQNLTNFVDLLLIRMVGSSMLLYLIAFSFDIFYISKEIVDMGWKNNWVKYPLYTFIGLIILTIILKYALKTI